MKRRKLSKSQAGKLGGLATKHNQGDGYYSKIGRKGAVAFWSKYKFEPFGRNDFAIVCRKTGQIVNFLYGNM